ncbi:MAG: MoxR family ATPase [Acidobacteria bacterium]|nr:MoxR family ATPase [Acidobacteriota bacterium]
MPDAPKSRYPRLSPAGLKGREGKNYFPDPDLVAAANAALTLGMPLLLTGEAGCGKTDFAFAAASGLVNDEHSGESTGRVLECYVRSDSIARDLLYHYDALSRFGDAQFGGDEGRVRAADARNYLHLEPLGVALVSPYRRVVLIDEVDKAPRDLPNDLLRELDQGSFEIREIPGSEETLAAPPAAGDSRTYRRNMRRPEGAPKPLMILTSNVERQLPNPFLRRCVFFHIPFPGTAQLREILASWMDEQPGNAFLYRVIEVFEVLREVSALTKRPSTSELLAWARVLLELHGESAVQSQLERFTRRRAEERSPASLPWKDLPALGCLIKLREDFDRLQALARA